MKKKKGQIQLMIGIIVIGEMLIIGGLIFGQFEKLQTETPLVDINKTPIIEKNVYTQPKINYSTYGNTINDNFDDLDILNMNFNLENI